MRTLKLTLTCLAMLMATAGQVKAGAIIFQFTEVSGDVLMTSSGTIDTANLVPFSPSGWGGTGIEDNGFTDIMGGTTVGTTDTAFAFSAGTDFSAWQTGNPWNFSFFGFNPTGTKGFSTYVFDPDQTPGLQVLSSQLDGSLWTPDQSWTASGHTFASIGMNPGTYSVSDANTGETITFQIGQSSEVPEPGTLALLGLGLAGMGFARRKKA